MRTMVALIISTAFLLGTIVPVLLLILGYAYLWRVGPFAH